MNLSFEVLEADIDFSSVAIKALCGIFFQYKAAAAAAKSLQSRLILCDPIDSSPPGFPVPGVLQAKTLEWVVISFSNAWSEKWKWSRSVVSDS